MRAFPILTAILVAAGLYLLVFERDRLSRPAPAAAPVTAAPAAAEDPPVRVAVRRIVAEAVETRLVLRGRTEADAQVVVRAQISGLVTSAPLRRGHLVAAGDVLCRIEDGTRPAALAEARAALARAEIADTAAARLSKGGYASETQALQARADRQAAEAAVIRAETDMTRTRLGAPIGGILETDTAETGSLLSAGDACATVIRLDPLRLVGFAAETDVGRLRDGAPASARLADGRQVEGRVAFISRAADPATRTFRVDVELANPDLSIRDGQSAEIAIATDATRAHLIPASALTLDDAGTMGVRLADAEDRVRFVPVAVLRDTGHGMLVTGLPDPARLIVVGQDYVAEGARIVPVPADALGAPPP